MSLRKQRSKQMMESPGYGSQVEIDTFKIRSQTDPEKFYEVEKTENGLVCSCPDHSIRSADCKHIHVALELIKQKKCYANQPVKILERSRLNLCKFCDSGNIIKKGFKKNKSGNVQLFKCKDCKRKFTTNFGFERMRYDPRNHNTGSSNVLSGNECKGY